MPPSTFNNHTTSEEAAAEFANSISGRVVFITGTSLGSLGGETARVVAKYATLVILAGRSASKWVLLLSSTAANRTDFYWCRLASLEASIKTETPSAKVRTLVVDFASLASVRVAANEVNLWSEPIDVSLFSHRQNTHLF